MSGSQKKIGLCVVLVAAVVAVYAQVIDHGFINLDDDQYVTANPRVLGGLSAEGIVWAFTEFASFNWHPLTWISHMLDVTLFGMDASGHHATNLLLHILNSVLLFWLLAKATGRDVSSAIVAALFALHPAHVESVAWVAERKDVLSTFFLLLTFGAYLRYCAKPNAKAMVLVAACFALGLLSKPMLVTLPFLLLLLDVWPLHRISLNREGLNEQLPGLLAEKIGLFGLTVASIAVTFVAQSTGGAMKAGSVLSLLQRFENALVAYVRYIAKAFVPSNLAIYYPHPGDWPAWAVLSSAALLIAITMAVLWRLKQQPYLAVGWFWFVGMLVPVVGLVQVGSQSMADRYTYVPFIGLSIAVVWGVGDWLGDSRLRLRIGATAAVVVTAAYGVAAWNYAGAWRDSISVFTTSLNSTDELYASVMGRGEAPENPSSPPHNGLYTPYYNLGTALAEARLFNKARQHFEIAIKAHPGFPDVYINLGVVLAQQGDLDGSKRSYERALAVDPGNELALRNLALLRQAMRGQ